MTLEGTTLFIPDDREFFDTDTFNRPDRLTKGRICKNLKKVVIGKSVSVLRSYDRNPEPFCEYLNLERIEVSPENKTYCDIDGVLFSKDGTRLITFPDNHSSRYIVPNSVIHIERSAFDYAKKLRKLTLGKNVKTIGLAAFFHCKKLRSIRLPEGLASIGPGAFSFCSHLQELHLPSTIEEIGHSAFYECTSLRKTTISDNGTQTFCTIEGVLFESATHTLIRVPPAYPVQVYSIPQGTTKIAEHSFYNCSKIQEIVIPPSVEDISGASLAMTTSLLRFTVDAKNPHFCAVDGILLSKDKTILIAYPGGKHGTYTVPDTIQELGDYCFFSVLYPKENLRVSIPNEGSVKKGFSIYNMKLKLLEEDENQDS